METWLSDLFSPARQKRVYGMCGLFLALIVHGHCHDVLRRETATVELYQVRDHLFATPQGHINTSILESMISGMPILYGYLVFPAPGFARLKSGAL